MLEKRPVNREAQKVLRGLSAGAIIWQNRKWWLRIRLAVLGYSYARIYLMSEEVRLKVVADAVGRYIGREGRPSNGVLLALLCLHLGNSIVVMTGFSLSQSGHSYNDKGRVRNHANADREVLADALARGARIYTNDPAFASESGLPLYRGEAL